MELNLPTMTLLELPQFSADDQKDILPGAPLLEDIERYHNARSQFLRDQETVQRWVEQTCPALIEQITDHKIKTLFKTMDSPSTNSDDSLTDEGDAIVYDDAADPAPDPVAALQAVIAEIEAIKADALVRLNGPASEKRQRMHEALMEVYGTLAARVTSYISNLSANRALSVLFTDDDDGDDDVQSASGVEARTQATST